MPIMDGLALPLVMAVLFGPHLWIRHVLARHSRERSDLPGTGGELARHLLDEAGLQDGLCIPRQNDLRVRAVTNVVGVTFRRADADLQRHHLTVRMRTDTRPQSVRFWVFCAALVAVAALSADDVSAQNSASLRQFLAAYRCSVVDRLERIYQTGDPSVHRDRYIAISVSEHPHGYVQCMFFDNRRKMLCEASSGYYFNKEGGLRTFWLSRDALAALRALGFSTDGTRGNHALEFEVKSPPDFNVIADLILKALHDAYDARAESRLRFNVPFARRGSSSCIPVS